VKLHDDGLPFGEHDAGTTGESVVHLLSSLCRQSSIALKY
jgi:hypothetical protein